MRYYLLSSSIIRGEDLNFSEKEVLELQRKNIGRLHNVLAMYELSADGTSADAASTYVLDRWIIARLNQLVADTTAGYQNYELDKATRPLTDFIDDVSVWYLRRSRERLKDAGGADKAAAVATLRHVLRTLALVMAPAMPFYAEYLWRHVKEEGDAESVHLAAWPAGGEVDEDLIAMMTAARQVVTQGLEARTKANIKVRQPLAALRIMTGELASLHELMKDELNVKEIIVAEEIGAGTVQLDTTLTPELLAEGAVRELMRAIQDARKQQGLQPADEITLTIETDDAGQAAITTHLESLQKTVGATAVTFDTVEGTVVEAGEYTFTIQLHH